ncbi:hypothetical protein DSECCO2_310070 [anaerobic digester metagenome]
MFFTFQSKSDIEIFIEKIKDAVDKTDETVEINDGFHELNKYRIFYNPESLLSYNELNLHFSNEPDDLLVNDPAETIVIAFNFNIQLLIEHKIISNNTISLRKIIFISDINFNIQNIIHEDELLPVISPALEKLYIQGCIFCMPVILAFGLNIVDLSNSAFLDEFAIFDLYDELKINYCIFHTIFLECYIFNKLNISFCIAERFELYPDQNDLNMDYINFNNTQITEVIINSHEYYERVNENYDIETNIIKITDSFMTKLSIANIQTDKLIIKRSEITKICFDQVISNDNLIIKELEYENFSFKHTLANGKEVRSFFNTSEIDHNKFSDELEKLGQMDETAQARGYAFEKYLKNLFEAYELEPGGSFKIIGEQIDGSFEFHNNVYLLEAKWISKPIDKSELVNFNEKVRSKSGFTRGLFISNSEYSKEALQTFAIGRKVYIILMTVDELSEMLTKKWDFRVLIHAKLRALAEKGEFYHKIKLNDQK